MNSIPRFRHPRRRGRLPALLASSDRSSKAWGGGITQRPNPERGSRDWAALVALSGGLVVVTSLLLRTVSSLYSGPVLAVGILLLLLPSASMIMIWLLADYLHGHGRIGRAAGLAVVLIVLVLAGLEVWGLATWWAK